MTICLRIFYLDLNRYDLYWFKSANCTSKLNGLMLPTVLRSNDSSLQMGPKPPLSTDRSVLPRLVRAPKLELPRLASFKTSDWLKSILQRKSHPMREYNQICFFRRSFLNLLAHRSSLSSSPTHEPYSSPESIHFYALNLDMS